MFEVVYILLAVLGSGMAGWIDLKTTDIPDWITVSMILLGLGLHGVESLVVGSVDPFIASLIAVILFGMFGGIMYFSGMWGGGDGLLLAGVGALVPVYSGYISWLPFPIAYLFNVLIIGLVYSLIYMGIIAMRNPRVKKLFFDQFQQDYVSIGGIVLAIIFLGYSSSIKLNNFLTGTGLLILLTPVIYLFSKIMEQNFYKRISTKDLREGDMIGENISRLGIGKLEIRGLTKQEVTKIRKFKKNVIVRDGIRYGLVFLLALLFTILFGFPMF